MASFGVVAKNSYNFIFGPTDLQGIAVLTNADILSQAQEQLALALMDYEPLEKAFSGGISVHAVSHEKAESALKAFGMFKEVFPYPKGYEDMLRAALGNPILRDTSLIQVTRLS